MEPTTPLIGAHSYHRLRSPLLRTTRTARYTLTFCLSLLQDLNWVDREGRSRFGRKPIGAQSTTWAERSFQLATALSARAVLFAEAPGLVRKALKINELKRCNPCEKICLVYMKYEYPCQHFILSLPQTACFYLAQSNMSK